MICVGAGLQTPACGCPILSAVCEGWGFFAIAFVGSALHRPLCCSFGVRRLDAALALPSLLPLLWWVFRVAFVGPDCGPAVGATRRVCFGFVAAAFRRAAFWVGGRPILPALLVLSESCEGTQQGSVFCEGGFRVCFCSAGLQAGIRASRKLGLREGNCEQSHRRSSIPL